MSIKAENLGFRETIRLIQFINAMIDDNPTDCIESTFEYDLNYDEPIIRMENGEFFLASDYNYAFDAYNNIETI